MTTEAILVSEEGLGISEKALFNCNASYQSELNNASSCAQEGKIEGATYHLVKAQSYAQKMLLNVPEEKGKKNITDAFENAFSKTLDVAENLKVDDIALLGRTMDEMAYLAKNFPGNKLRKLALIRKVEDTDKKLSTEYKKYVSEVSKIVEGSK
ncbi:MAG: hypothetical protein ABIE55_03485 [Candidatus Aenigmatarchaeota archaeon]